MDENNNPTVIADDVVVSLQYTLKVNNEIVDSADETEPLEFLQGYRNIIPGLEKELYGLKVGDTKNVTVQPADGYGEIDPEAVMDVPRDEFPEDIPLELGLELEVRDEDGEILPATVTEITTDSIRLDFNHPLAGEILDFELKILELRAASPEELEHGHVHGDDGDEFDEEFEDDFIEYIDEDGDDEEEEEEEE